MSFNFLMVKSFETVIVSTYRIVFSWDLGHNDGVVYILIAGVGLKVMLGHFHLMIAKVGKEHD